MQTQLHRQQLHIQRHTQLHTHIITVRDNIYTYIHSYSKVTHDIYKLTVTQTQVDTETTITHKEAQFYT